MERLLIAGAVVVVAVVVALVLDRRRPPRTGPVAGTRSVPGHVDRRDFARPETPWLVAVFTSATCDSCTGVWDKAQHLESEAVAVHEVEYSANRDLHQRYAIDSVPLVIVADDSGVVQASFLGPVTAADLWATLADLREPGSVPPGCDQHRS